MASRSNKSAEKEPKGYQAIMKAKPTKRRRRKAALEGYNKRSKQAAESHMESVRTRVKMLKEKAKKKK